MENLLEKAVEYKAAVTKEKAEFKQQIKEKDQEIQRLNQELAKQKEANQLAIMEMTELISTMLMPEAPEG